MGTETPSAWMYHLNEELWWKYQKELKACWEYLPIEEKVAKILMED